MTAILCMNELKLYWTINNFSTYYNMKQLKWQHYQTTSKWTTKRL